MGVQHVQHVGVQDVQRVLIVYRMYSMPARPLLVLGPGVKPSVSPQTPAGEHSTGRAEGLEEGRKTTVLFLSYYYFQNSSNKKLYSKKNIRWKSCYALVIVTDA